MTFETLTYVSEDNRQITFSVDGTYHVNIQKDVTGLSDLDATVYSTSSMNQDGDTFTSARLEPREIEVKGCIPTINKDTYTAARRSLLKILNPKIGGTLYYTYGTFERKIGARVSESPKFTHKDTIEEFEVVFLCLDPFWQDDSETTQQIASWIGAFEFPVEIDEEDDEDQIFGYRSESVIVTVSNDGDVDTGMRIKFSALGDLSNPMLLNVDTYEYIKLDFDMVSGDVIVIDTTYGNKSVTLTRNGVESNAYRYIDVDSTFLQMEVGENTFRYDADDGLDNLECTIYFSPKYLGV